MGLDKGHSIFNNALDCLVLTDGNLYACYCTDIAWLMSRASFQLHPLKFATGITVPTSTWHILQKGPRAE